MHLSTEEPGASRMLETFGEVGRDVLLKLKIKKLLRKIKSINLTAGVKIKLKGGKCRFTLRWPIT